MKVKHTKNGNLKLTVSPQEAEAIRSILLETSDLYEREAISFKSRTLGEAFDLLLREAGVLATF
jgi:hypothetical protein